MENNIIAVDFDGTLCENKYPEIGEPNMELIDFIMNCQLNGDKVILWTCRNEKQTKAAVDWCSEKGLVFDAVNENLPEIITEFGGDTRKIFANVYIDDRNVSLYSCRKKTSMDLWAENEAAIQAYGDLCVSSKTGYHIHELKELMTTKLPTDDQTGKIVGDLLSPLDFVVLVVPIDSAAPKGRLILPQQQVIRDVLESGATAIVCRDTELADTLKKLGQPPKLVITDSQAFASVSKDTPKNIPLTSFSILFSRYKGDLQTQIEGVKMLDKLKDGDTILMAEGCTHHRQCDDIGTVKLPRWISEYTGKKLNFATSSGGGFPENLSPYRLIVHCGGCTLSKREMAFRIAEAKDQNVPIVNYGTMIAQLKGVLKRSIAPFADELS